MTSTEASRIREFGTCLADDVRMNGGDMKEVVKPYDHLKRLRITFEVGISVRPNPNYLHLVLDTLTLCGATDAPTLGVPGHEAPQGTTLELTPYDASLCCSCVGAFGC